MPTQQEITNSRWHNQFFSKWIREKLPDSSTCFLVTDIDFVLLNYKTKKVMLLEVKTNATTTKIWQHNVFARFDKWIKRGIDTDWQYLGFHILTFEKTDFTNGKVYWDGSLIDEPLLIKKLSFANEIANDSFFTSLSFTSSVSNVSNG